MVESSTWPSEEEVHEFRMEQLSLQTDKALIGRIQAYDAATQTADVVPMVKQQIPRADGTYDFEDLPMLPCVPVLWPGVGPWFVAMSVEPGDSVLVICLDGDHSPWWASRRTEGMTGLARATQGRVVPADLGRHHLAHAVAIPARFEHRHNALRNAPRQVVAQNDPLDAKLVIGSDLDAGTRLTIFGDGRMRVTKGNGTTLELSANGDVHLAGAPGVTKLLALAELVDARLETLRDAFNDHTHSAGEALIAPSGGGAVTGATGGPVSSVTSLASVGAAKTRGV